MKGAISTWVNACENILKKKLNFSLALMITGDMKKELPKTEQKK